MPVQLPGRDVIENATLQEFRDRIPEANTGEGEPYYLLAQIIASAVWSVFQPIAFVADQIFPTSSSEEFLVRHGSARKIFRKPAAKATGFMIITGIAGASQPSGSLITDSSGGEYTLDIGVTLVAPLWLRGKVQSFSSSYPDRFIALDSTNMAVGDVFFLGGELFCIKALPGGALIVVYGRISGDPTGTNLLAVAGGVRAPITASLEGSSGNLPFRSAVTLSTPSTNVNAIGQIAEMGGGSDIESIKAWAERIEEIASEYPAGGNRAQLVAWAKGMSTLQERQANAQKAYALGVERAFNYSLFRGLGTSDIVVQGVVGARHLSTSVIAAIQNYIAPAVPTDANPGQVAPGADVLITDFTELATNISIDVRGGVDNPPDYDILGGAAVFAVAAGGNSSRINTTTSPVGFVVPGNRICFYVGPPLWLIMTKTTNVDGGGFFVSPPIPANPAPGAFVYPGSSLIEPIRDSLLAMLDTFGPGDTNPPSRYPAPTTTAPDRLNRALIDKVVMTNAGVANVIVSVPVADVVPPPKQQVTLNVLTIRHLP